MKIKRYTLSAPGIIAQIIVPEAVASEDWVRHIKSLAVRLESGLQRRILSERATHGHVTAQFHVDLVFLLFDAPADPLRWERVLRNVRRAYTPKTFFFMVPATSEIASHPVWQTFARSPSREAGCVDKVLLVPGAAGEGPPNAASWKDPLGSAVYGLAAGMFGTCLIPPDLNGVCSLFRGDRPIIAGAGAAIGAGRGLRAAGRATTILTRATHLKKIEGIFAYIEADGSLTFEELGTVLDHIRECVGPDAQLFFAANHKKSQRHAVLEVILFAS